MNRHKGVEWSIVQSRLVSSPEKLRSLGEMEASGGEPDVAGHDGNSGEFIFIDGSAESPAGRRSFCYDREALDKTWTSNSVLADLYVAFARIAGEAGAQGISACLVFRFISLHCSLRCCTLRA